MTSVMHHPDDNLLVEFSAGTLEWALAIAVSGHLHYCQRCRFRVSELNGLGGGMLENAVATDVDEGALERVLGTIHRLEHPSDCRASDDRQVALDEPYQRARSQSGSPSNASSTGKKSRLEGEIAGLPVVIRKVVSTAGKLKWRSVTPCLKTSRLKTGQSKYEVAFHKIAQGGKVAEHGHRGMEVTLVLRGSFSDESGVYGKGDFLVREPGQVHRPTATQNEDCLCLSVLEAPVAVTGALGRLINPFLRISPS